MAKLTLPSNIPETPDSSANARTRLIVNADDFGLHPAINQAIIQAHEIGIVTSCSIMPLGGAEPAFIQAVEMSRSLPTLDIGLHFCLVGMPGQPATFAEFLPRFLAKKYPQIPVEAMVHRQIDLLEQVGIKPSHIDSHEHTHAVPEVMRAVCRAAVERGIRSVRLPIDTPLPGSPISRMLGTKAITEYAKRAKVILEEYDLWHPDTLYGIADTGHLSEGRVMAILNQLKPGVTEIMCHPGAHNARLESALKWGFNWEADRAAMVSERVTYKISALDIELTTFAAAESQASEKTAQKATRKQAQG